MLLDDEINEMMALTDEELALYQRMDAERKGREEKEWADESSGWSADHQRVRQGQGRQGRAAGS